MLNITTLIFAFLLAMNSTFAAATTKKTTCQNLKDKINASEKKIGIYPVKFENVAKGTSDTSSCYVQAHAAHFQCNTDAQSAWSCYKATTCGNLLASMKTKWSDVNALNTFLNGNEFVKDVSMGYGNSFPSYCNFRLHELYFKCVLSVGTINLGKSDYSCKKCLPCDESATVCSTLMDSTCPYLTEY